MSHADLLEGHSQKLTREIKAFDSELKVSSPLSRHLHDPARAAYQKREGGAGYDSC